MKLKTCLSASAAVFALAAGSVLSVGVASVGLAGCGNAADAKTAKITPGEMPAGESWTGVYFHPVYGHLHIVEQDTNIVGKWKRADSSAWGELSGTKTGNVVHFTWKEHKYGLVGPAAESHGKGYFVYKMGEEGKIAQLDGQFGLNDDETGSDWHNVKQVREQPDLNSINGDLGGVAPPGAGKWDEGSSGGDKQEGK